MRSSNYQQKYQHIEVYTRFDFQSASVWKLGGPTLIARPSASWELADAARGEAVVGRDQTGGMAAILRQSKRSFRTSYHERFKGVLPDAASRGVHRR